MAKINDLKNLLSQMNIPVSYWEFGEKTPAPCICYVIGDTDSTYANSCSVKRTVNARVELYTKRNDFTTNKKLEKIFADNGILYDKSTGYVSERKEIVRYYSMVLDEDEEE